MQYGKPYLAGKYEQIFFVNISISVKLLMADPMGTFQVSLQKCRLVFQPVHNTRFFFVGQPSWRQF